MTMKKLRSYTKYLTYNDMPKLDYLFFNLKTPCIIKTLLYDFFSDDDYKSEGIFSNFLLSAFSSVYVIDCLFAYCLSICFKCFKVKSNFSF